MAAQARFLAHAIGNPLAGLSLSLELLEQTELQPAQARYVARCRNACERLLTDQALLAAQGGARQHAAGWVEVAPVAHAAFAHVHRSVATGTAQLEVGDGATHVWAVAPLLQSALTEIVANAADAAGDRGALGIRCERRATDMLLTVWDDGPGVAPERVPALFRSRTTSKPRGFGLGLLRTFQLIERAQGGQVTYAPRHPNGSLFAIVLPLPPLA